MKGLWVIDDKVIWGEGEIIIGFVFYLGIVVFFYVVLYFMLNINVCWIE